MQDQQNPQEFPLCNSVIEACRRLSIGRTSLYELIAAREIRVVKLGQRTLVPESELQRWVAKRIEAVAA